MKHFLLVALLASFISTLATPTLAGNEGGHGGDPYAFEFFELSKEINKSLRSPDVLPLNEKVGLNLGRLDEILAKPLQIHSTEGENTMLRGVEVAAINNFPQSDRVLINRTMWRESRTDQKLKLVLHELLGLLGLELDTYDISYEYVRHLEKIYDRLLDSKVLASPIRYYGRCIGSPPLYATGDACSIQQPTIAGAVDCARAKALTNCLSEKSGDCNVIETATLILQKSEQSGFKYCEVTALAK